MDRLEIKPGLSLSHIGPPLDKGRMPAAFYFALSGQESLELDPFNQPALFLQEKMRVFSLDLPAHGPNLNPAHAIAVWAKEFSEGKDPLTPFFEQVHFAIEALIDRGLIYREKVGFMGLSRGGFIALHIAAKFLDVRVVVCFAPMTSLSYAKEFQDIQNEKIESFDLKNHGEFLYKLPIKIYIGNRDTRVGTEKNYALAKQLAETSFQHGIRSPPVEMVVAPSIGHMGHGTSKKTFEAGARYLGEKLGVFHD